MPYVISTIGIFASGFLLGGTTEANLIRNECVSFNAMTIGNTTYSCEVKK